VNEVKDQFETRMHELGEFIREQRRVARYHSFQHENDDTVPANVSGGDG
jgi:hypothetical protein